MGLESTLRSWALRSGLQRSRLVVAVYRWICRVRFRRRWDQPVAFRGGLFSIGRDLSLYPAVRNGGFESEELEALLARVSPGDTVWDVGGNIGIYSVLLGRAAPEGHVVAFEPVPQSRERLVGNLERNGVTNVTVEPLALSDQDGEALMAIFPDAPGCDRIVIESSNGEAPESMRVATVTGSGYCDTSPFGEPDVIKVDIEGHEPEFLRGAWDIIDNRKPTLMMEVNPGTWTGEGRFETWERLLADLFALYGAGDWFNLAGAVRVTSLDVRELGPGPYTLILPAS